MKPGIRLIVICQLLLGELLNPFAAKINSKPTVLLVSFDGFRWDYMDKTATPNFDSIVKTGVKAKYIKNAFVTKTFPNHFTIVTGLYEESHGIVANTMYDPEFNSWFHLNNTEPRWWNGGEPIWVTNQRCGGDSGTVFWPGSDVKIRGRHPTYSLKYDYHMPYKDRVDTIIRLLGKKDPPTLLTLYFEEPDHSGHRYGPDSKEVIQAIHTADNTTGYLIKQLKTKGFFDKVIVYIIMQMHLGETIIMP
jgi:ectonucleotide pyrophosphatase/phosphodiesterase family protein 5